MCVSLDHPAEMKALEERHKITNVENPPTDPTRLGSLTLQGSDWVLLQYMASFVDEIEIPDGYSLEDVGRVLHALSKIVQPELVIEL